MKKRTPHRRGDYHCPVCKRNIGLPRAVHEKRSDHIANITVNAMEDAGMVRVKMHHMVIQSNVPRQVKRAPISGSAYPGSSHQLREGLYAPRWALLIAARQFFNPHIRGLLLRHFERVPTLQQELDARSRLGDDLYVFLVQVGRTIPGWPTRQLDCWDRALLRGHQQVLGQVLRSKEVEAFIEQWNPFGEGEPKP